jgi:hypothetical protein
VYAKQALQSSIVVATLESVLGDDLATMTRLANRHLLEHLRQNLRDPFQMVRHWDREGLFVARFQWETKVMARGQAQANHLVKRVLRGQCGFSTMIMLNLMYPDTT